MKKDMLTVDQEVLLGEKITERRELLKKLEKENREPDSKEKKIIREGLKASHELISHYEPLMKKLYNSHVNGRTMENPEDYDDIWSECMYTALKTAQAYNPWPRKNMSRPSRFTLYLTSAIKSSMNTASLRSTTLFSSSIPTLSRSIVRKATEESMEESLGRKPTESEVTTVIGFSDNKDIPPVTSSMLSTMNGETDRIGYTHDEEVSNQGEWLRLANIIDSVFNEEVSSAIKALMIADEYNKTFTESLISNTNYGARQLRDVSESIRTLVSHPYVIHRIVHELRKKKH